MISLKSFKLTLFITICAFANFAENVDSTAVVSAAPEQIHLSLGKSISEMTVTWTTYANVSESVVQFGIQKTKKLNQTATGGVTEFVDNGKRVHFIHRVRLAELKPNTTYDYKCGSKGNMSSVFSFTTFPEGEHWSPRMLIYGDLGVEHGAIIQNITSEVTHRTVDVVFHNGDIAYDLGDDNSKMGDRFMRLMEGLTTQAAFQTSVGNHETSSTANLQNYLNRFTMVDQTTTKNVGDFKAYSNLHYYAFYLGPALVISLNMEFYVAKYAVHLDSKIKAEQERWLVERLKAANTAEARAKHPWIIVAGHQPLYCHSSGQDSSCKSDADQTRDGLEEIFFQWGVDIVFGAHIHNYERQYPMHQWRRAEASFADPYRNPKAPVYIVSGAGGCPELIDVQYYPRPEWNAYSDSQFGYGILEVVNETTVLYQQKAIIYDCVNATEPLQIIDQVEIVQEHHGPFPKL